jgi:hypothetical protein
VAVLEKCLQCFLLLAFYQSAGIFHGSFFESACNVVYYWHLEKSAGISLHPAVIF